MDTAMIAADGSVEIPKRMCEELGWAPGQTLCAVAYGGRLELLPVVPVRSMRGFLRRIDTGPRHDEDRT